MAGLSSISSGPRSRSAAQGLVGWGMLGSIGDRLREYSLDDRVVTRVAGMWHGEAEILVVDFVGPQESERVLVEHDGKFQCKVSGPPTLAQFVAERLPARAIIIPAVALDPAHAFEVPVLDDQSSPFGVGTHADALMRIEWSTPRVYQAHAIRTVWASWPQGLVIARVDELNEGDSTDSIAWWPGPGTVVHTASLMADLRYCFTCQIFSEEIIFFIFLFNQSCMPFTK